MATNNTDRSGQSGIRAVSPRRGRSSTRSSRKRATSGRVTTVESDPRGPETRHTPLSEFRRSLLDNKVESLASLYSEPFLLITPGSGQPSIYPLPAKSSRQRVKLGSANECDIRLDATSIAPLHLEFFYHPILRSWCLSDQGAAKGTTLDKRVIAPFAVCSLHKRSKITLGDTRIQIYEPEELEQEVLHKFSRRRNTERVKRPLSSRALRRPRNQIDETQADAFLRPFVGDVPRLEGYASEAAKLSPQDFIKSHPGPYVLLDSVIMGLGKEILFNRSALSSSYCPVWDLSGSKVCFVGRDEQCDITLQAKVVSKRHAKLKKDL